MFPNISLAHFNCFLFYRKNSQTWLRSWDGRDRLQYVVCTPSPCSGDTDRFLEEIRTVLPCLAAVPSKDLGALIDLYRHSIVSSYMV